MTGLTELRHMDLHPSPLNPRKHARSEAEIAELAASILERGVLQNLVVRKNADGYEIAAGEGRWRAVAYLIEQGKAAQDFKLPVAIRELSDVDVIEIGLVENTHRNDLHPLDEANAYLDLYTRAASGGGKKAAAKTIEAIAGRVNRTTRYVQKRIKIARDLIPEWKALLEKGWLNLSAAQAIAAAGKDDQAVLLRDVSHWQTKEPDEERTRGLTASDVRDELDQFWRPMSSALFDPALYTGEIDDVEGEPHATDGAAFDALQADAAAAIMLKGREQVKAEEIEFIDQGSYFHERDYEQRTLADGTPDPAGGIFIEKHSDGEIRVHRGLFKSKEKLRQEKQEAAHKASAAKERAKAKKKVKAERATKAEPKPIDPRPAQVHAFMRKNPVTRNAVSLFATLTAFSDGIDWAREEFEPDGARAFLAEAAGGKLPSGAALLSWLLEQKPALINAAHAAATELVIEGGDIELIEKPSKAEQILFDHCGAKLPDELALAGKPKNAKTAGKKLTASKSKPGLKKKGKKS